MREEVVYCDTHKTPYSRNVGGKEYYCHQCQESYRHLFCEIHSIDYESPFSCPMCESASQQNSEKLLSVKCLVHEIESDGFKDWHCPLCDQENLSEQRNREHIEKSEALFRKRFSIKKLKDIFQPQDALNSFSGESLVLCIDDRMIPFQTETHVNSNSQGAEFVVRFELYTSGLEFK